MADDPASPDEPAPATDAVVEAPSARDDGPPPEPRKKKKRTDDPERGDLTASDDADTPRKKKKRPDGPDRGDLTSSDDADADAAPKKKKRVDHPGRGDPPSDEVGAPKKKKRADDPDRGDLTSSDDASADAPKKKKRAGDPERGDLTSSDDGNADAPKKKKRREGDLTSSDDANADAPPKKKAEPEKALVSSDAAAKKRPGSAEELPRSGLTREAEDALFGLFVVKEGVCSEAHVEKAITRQRAGADVERKKSLARLLVEQGVVSVEDRDRVLGLLDPEVIPGYRIEGEAGRGGMGVVYKAKQLSMDRVVAVKILARRLSNDQTYVTKFLAEARSAGKLNHENIVAAIDAGATSGLHFFVMEFVSGRSVAEVVEAEGPLPWARAFEVAEQVARGLAHAHQAGLVHRDVKPENILLTADGRAKLCDLGLAKAAQIAGTGGKSDMTEGTPYYCSPEQAVGRTDIDARSDVYSLGTTLYHVLKGEPPYDGDSPRAILVKQVREPFPDLDERLPDVPPAYRRLLWEMVKKDREQRLPSMRAFEERLVAARRAETVALAPRRQASGGLGPVALVGAVFVVFLGVGALTTWAIVGGGDPQVVGGTDVAPPRPGTDLQPSTDAEPPAEDTDVGPPRVSRVTDDAPRDPPRTSTTERLPPPPTTDAGRALGAARRAQRAEDPVGSREALLAVVTGFPNTPEAEEARSEAAALNKAVIDHGFKLFEALTTSAIAAVRDGEYRRASEAIAEFADEWTPRAVPGLPEQLGNLRRAVEQQAQVRLEEAVKKLEGATGADAVATAQREVDDLMGRAPQPVAEKFKARLEALTRARAAREADAAWQAVVTRRDEALRRGDRAGAAQVLAGARTYPPLEPVRERVARAEADLAELSRAWDAFDARCRALADDDRARLRLRQGELRGRLLDYDPIAWKGSVKPYAQKDQLALDLRDLHPEELVGFALPAAEGGRANVLFFLARGVPDAATLAYAQWLGSGGKDTGGVLAAELERSLASASEARVAELIDRALAPGASTDAVIAAAEAIQPSDHGTKPYRERRDALVEAYRTALQAQLESAPELLFKGKLERTRGSEVVTLRYAFKNEGEVLDWTADTTVNGSSRGDNPEGMLVKGKVTNIARFQGGELSVELKATSASGRQPNLNVVLGDRGGWTGVLLGLGFAYGAMDDLRVDPTAPKKPGYTVPLPANVCIVLDGREPRADGPNFAAETAPSVQGAQGRAHKFDAARFSDGGVRLRLRGRDVFRLPPVPDWDRPGSVGLAPFSTDVVVHELEIVGRLDPAWITARARFVATTEAANALPPPR